MNYEERQEFMWKQETFERLLQKYDLKLAYYLTNIAEN